MVLLLSHQSQLPRNSRTIECRSAIKLDGTTLNLLFLAEKCTSRAQKHAKTPNTQTHQGTSGGVAVLWGLSKKTRKAANGANGANGADGADGLNGADGADRADPHENTPPGMTPKNPTPRRLKKAGRGLPFLNGRPWFAWGYATRG